LTPVFLENLLTCIFKGVTQLSPVAFYLLAKISSQWFHSLWAAEGAYGRT